MFLGNETPRNFVGMDSNAMNDHPTNPLHGITLKVMLEYLLLHYGWEGLGKHIKINCFLKDPSIASSLKFLRRTPWARAKVEELYLGTMRLEKEKEMASKVSP